MAADKNLDNLLEEVVRTMVHGDEEIIDATWQLTKNYVKHLKNMNIHYNWKKYELTEVLYTEWKNQNRTLENT